MSMTKQIIDELSNIMTNALEETMKVADKYGLDRDETLKKMAEKLHFAVSIGTFTHYEFKN